MLACREARTRQTSRLRRRKLGEGGEGDEEDRERGGRGSHIHKEREAELGWKKWEIDRHSHSKLPRGESGGGGEEEVGEDHAHRSTSDGDGCR